MESRTEDYDRREEVGMEEGIKGVSPKLRAS
jgi:hypothetical protein